MINQPINLAVIGCGHIGKRHAEMIARHPEAKLAALVDIKEKKDLGLAQADVPFFSSLNSFLESDVAADVDVVSIATPNGYHAQQALEVLMPKSMSSLKSPWRLPSRMQRKSSSKLWMCSDKCLP